ncbi:MAG: TerC family protein [Actinobacteria bacterium]|nr:TerC family protein [Actinomycetota bacterium]
MGAATLLWIALPVVVLTALVLDLFVFHRANEPIPTREAVIWTGIWGALGLGFGVAIWLFLGPTIGTEFFTGYLIEYSLSVDNVAVFAILFAALAVPPELRYRALFWGVILAILLRGILIAVGAALLEAFWWMPFVFGVFLIVTGIRMARHTDTTGHPEDSRILTLLRRGFPVTDGYHAQRLVVRQDGRRFVTPLFIALLALAFFDLMFAVDSVPAIYAVTDDPFIVLAANAFALLGLRTLYFAIATSLERFVYLQPTLAIVLGWVGFKMIISHWFHMPAPLSLAVVLVILAIGIVASVRKNRQTAAAAEG